MLVLKFYTQNLEFYGIRIESSILRIWKSTTFQCESLDNFFKFLVKNILIYKILLQNIDKIIFFLSFVKPFDLTSAVSVRGGASLSLSEKEFQLFYFFIDNNQHRRTFDMHVFFKNTVQMCYIHRTHVAASNVYSTSFPYNLRFQYLVSYSIVRHIQRNIFSLFLFTCRTRFVPRQT